jgi:hypothetical protein
MRPSAPDHQLHAAARFYLEQFEADAQAIGKARIRLLAAAQSFDRLTRVSSLLAMLCGENTARSALAASARRHHIEIHRTVPESQWQRLLADLVRIATELCGRPAGVLLFEVGQ